MKSILISIVVAIGLLVSGDANAQKKYENLGITFKIPKGWKIKGELPEKNAISFTCEKEGDNESGTMSFIYIGRNMDLNSFLMICMQNEESSENMNDGKNFIWGDTTEVRIGEYMAKKVAYKVNIADFPFSGSIMVFKACGNMVMLNPMEADEDKEKNKRGFEGILGTIKCK